MKRTQLKAAFLLLSLACQLYAVAEYVRMPDVSAADDTVEVFNRGVAELNASHKE